LRRLDLTPLTSYGAVEQALASDIPDAQLRQFLIKNLARGGDQAFRWRIGLDELIAGYDELTQAVSFDRQIDGPACFIRAGKSRFIGSEDMAAIHRSFTNARIAEIADAGHWVHSDAPERFFQIVTGFLASDEG
jgi:esterase